MNLNQHRKSFLQITLLNMSNDFILPSPSCTSSALWWLGDVE